MGIALTQPRRAVLFVKKNGKLEYVIHNPFNIIKIRQDFLKNPFKITKPTKMSIFFPIS